MTVEFVVPVVVVVVEVTPDAVPDADPTLTLAILFLAFTIADSSICSSSQRTFSNAA